MGDGRRPPGSGFRPPQRLLELLIRLPSPRPVLPGIFGTPGAVPARAQELEGGPQGPRQSALVLGQGQPSGQVQGPSARSVYRA